MKTKKITQNLILDFDDTLFYTLPVVMAYINQTYGIESKESDYLDNSGFHKIIQKYTNNPLITFEEVYNSYRINFALSPKWHKDVEPMAHVCKVVPELAKKYNLFIATMRSDRGAYLVNGLLESYIPKCIKMVHYAIRYKEKENTYWEFPKKDFILGLKGKNVAFIDDTLKEVQRVKDFCPSLLLDPKNKYGCLAEEVQSVRSWEEIGKRFL